MNKLITTYGDFYNMVLNNPDMQYWVKTHEGELSKINAVVKKESDMLNIGFADGSSICCADQHAFMDNDGNPIFAEDLVIHSRVMNQNGTSIVSSIKKSDETTAYDIAIDSPHWYTNVDGGLIHHNTSISLHMVSSYLKRYPEAICLYYDSEFGSTVDSLKAFDIDTERTLHIPIENIEQLKFDMVQKLEEIKKGDKVIILIDSIGNIASKKEVEDALDSKSVGDMTRSKMLKSFWRIVTPHFTTKDIPCIAIAHTYKEQGGMYPKDIIGGGNGGLYAANAAWIITKAQEKDGTDLIGFRFMINIEKSRFVIEKSKIPLFVGFETGINEYSGILDLAVESGLVIKPSNGWYSLVTDDGEISPKKFRAADTATEDFLGVVLKSTKFQEFIKNKYRLTYKQMSAKPTVTEPEDHDELDQDVME